MNLQHWDIKDVFTVAQTARLITGWDPEVEHISDAALAAKVRFVERELSRSAENAMQGLLTFFSEDLDKLGDPSWVVRVEGGWLPSHAVILAIDAFGLAKAELAKADGAERTAKLLARWTEILNRHYTDIEHKLCANDRSSSTYSSENLTRSCIHRWLKSLGLDSEYSFATLNDAKALSGNQADGSEIPHPRTERNYVALIAAMAIDKYGYEPDAARSAIPGDLSVLLRTNGFQLTDEVIRRYLKEGSGHLNPKHRR